LILTAHGLRPVDMLRPGDLVATLLPRGPFFVPIAWIGARPAAVGQGETRSDWPVLVRRHAIGNGVPSTDILLAPEHAIYIGDSLYLARMLVIGRSIAYRRPAPGPTRYWGLGLEVPNVVLAQNLPIETLMPAAAAAYAADSTSPRAAAPAPERSCGRPALRLVKA
jgi:antigen 43